MERLYLNSVQITMMIRNLKFCSSHDCLPAITQTAEVVYYGIMYLQATDLIICLGLQSLERGYYFVRLA